MSACEHLDYEFFPIFHSDASIAEHTTFGWYVSIVHLSPRCPGFDRTTVMLCFRLSRLWSCQASHVASQVSLHSGLLPLVFGYTGHVCKLAIRPDVAASISSNITFAACLDHRFIFASQVKSLPFQHRLLHFIPDCCYRCSDALGVLASSPFSRTVIFEEPSIGHLFDVSPFSEFCQDQLQLLQSTSISFFSPDQ